MGFAALTMNRDLHLTARNSGGPPAFSISVTASSRSPAILPCIASARAAGWARIMLSWGLAVAAMALAVGPKSYYVLRLLVGAAEAGFFPGVIFYLSMWFPVQHRTRVLAWFLVAIPISSVIGGPISALILQMNGMLGLTGWQWVSIIEGAPSCLCGLFTLFLLADEPKDAKWLTQPERDALMSMLEQEPRERERRSFLPSRSRMFEFSSMPFCFSTASAF